MKLQKISNLFKINKSMNSIRVGFYSLGEYMNDIGVHSFEIVKTSDGKYFAYWDGLYISPKNARFKKLIN